MNRPFVSDHAILRFVERALDFERAPVESLIHAAVGSAKLGCFKLPGYNLYARVINNTVVTVVPMAAPPKRRKAKKAKTVRPIKERELVPKDWRDDIPATAMSAGPL